MQHAHAAGIDCGACMFVQRNLVTHTHACWQQHFADCILAAQYNSKDASVARAAMHSCSF